MLLPTESKTNSKTNLLKTDSTNDTQLFLETWVSLIYATP
jgi:hypothetical protein